MSAARSSRPQARAPALAWLLCAALLFAQWAGLAHRVAHGAAHASREAHASHATHAGHERQAPHAADGPPTAALAVSCGVFLHDAGDGARCGGAQDAWNDGAQSAWHETFAGHDEGDAECRLYDQLSHADALATTPLPFAGPRVRGLPVPGGSVVRGARCCAAYLARAPPRG